MMDPATENILDKFEQISAIPRCSKKEARIARWIENWAAQAGYAVRKDKAGNLCVTLPASPGSESAPVVVIQGHLDMVCVKSEASNHNFDYDPIRPVIKDDWLTAEQTTLGADNGIAIAMALALAESEQIKRPPVELLFTVDEESGLVGAGKMEAGFVTGKILLNLDSEEEGEFTVGCAGGQDTLLSMAIETSSLPGDWRSWRLSVQGLRGGHSGIDIAKHRGSANRLLARGLCALNHALPLRLISIDGGLTHNAIARDAHAVISVPAARESDLQAGIDEFYQTARDEYGRTEPNLTIGVQSAAKDTAAEQGFSETDTQTVIRLLMALPHGVRRMSPDIPGLVETSNNLATVKIVDNRLQILSSQRSSAMSRLAEITGAIESAAALAGAKVTHQNSYPAWPPNMASALIQRCITVYERLHGKQPLIQSIHAGLECGLIGAKHPGMDMISFGPTIENPHSPDERLHIPSISRTWDFLVALLESYTA